MKNKKELLKDIIAIFIYILTFFIIYLILTKDNNLFASNTDFRIQHYLIPEYFRNLFYSTHDLLPDFALNLGSGQNIYYLSYYGLLNPIILISYLLPQINMLDYIIASSCLIVIISTILFYFFLKKHNYNYKTRLVTALLFLLSGPLIFHAKRHIMFINYMPFLILGLFGVDKYFEKKDITLLSICITLTIYTSYYFSISGMIVLLIYYIYSFIKNNNKNFIKNTIHLSLPFILGIMISSIITLPTIYTLLNGRQTTTTSINIFNLIKPNLNMLYSSYGPGLTLISLIALIIIMFSKKREDKFLSITCLLICIFPIFNYILNGTLYINAKSLIPFIPLILLITATLLQKLFTKKTNIIQIILMIYLITSSFIMCLKTNNKDVLMKKNDLNNQEYTTTEKLINNITSLDESFYRINNQVYDKDMINKVSYINEYKTTMYSSTYNSNYKTFYYNTINNNNQFRNCFMISSSKNLLSQILLSEKYIITKDNLSNTLELIESKNGINVYKNNYALPLGYATSHIISTSTYNNLDYPTNILSLLNNIIIEKNIKTNKINNNIKKANIDYNIIEKNNIEITENNKKITINAKDNASIKIKLNANTQNKLLLLSFSNLNNPNKDLSITINNETNTLTSKNWKYHNNNFTFNYFLYNTDILNITLTKGIYELNNFNLYIVDYDLLKNNDIDEYIINKKNTKGDIISGTINVTNNSYFNISIPYDKGFIIKVDGKITKYEKTNLSFIGFKLDKGYHNITIEYIAPYKKISLLISLLGIILLTIYKIIYKKSIKINK